MNEILLANRNIIAWSLCLAGAMLAGCGGAEGQGEETATTEDPVMISPAGLPDNTSAQYGAMWQYNTGGPVYLNSGNGTSCYLTDVWGKFADFRDEVYISWNGSTYYISGSHGVGTPSADAFCQSAPAVIANSWQSGNAPVVLGSASNLSCYLTSLSGNFTAAGAEIRLRVVNGNWQLDGTGAVAAGAGCVSATPYPSMTFTASNNPPPMMPGSNGQTIPGAVNFAPNYPYFCALTGVKGYLLDKSWVGTYLFARTGDGTSSWEWHLGGKNTRGILAGLEPLTGTAHCNL